MLYLEIALFVPKAIRFFIDTAMKPLVQQASRQPYIVNSFCYEVEYSGNSIYAFHRSFVIIRWVIISVVNFIHWKTSVIAIIMQKLPLVTNNFLLDRMAPLS